MYLLFIVYWYSISSYNFVYIFQFSIFCSHDLCQFELLSDCLFSFKHIFFFLHYLSFIKIFYFNSSGKFTPIKQWFYFDGSDSLADEVGILADYDTAPFLFLYPFPFFLYLRHSMLFSSQFNLPFLSHSLSPLSPPPTSFFILNLHYKSSLYTSHSTLLPFPPTAAVCRSSGPKGLPIRWTNSCVWNGRTAQARVFKCIFSGGRGHRVGYNLFLLVMYLYFHSHHH